MGIKRFWWFVTALPVLAAVTARAQSAAAPTLSLTYRDRR